MEASDRDPQRDHLSESAEEAPGSDSQEGRSHTWLHLLQRVGGIVGPALLTAGGFVGFLAFAGSVIVWTRFEAANVPPDQVVAAYPQGELVAVASALLLVFGFVGVLAVVSFFLINHEGGQSIGVFRGLLGLLAVEGLAAIAFVDSSWGQDQVLAAELFLLPLFVAFWATFVYERPALSGSDGSGDDGKGTGFAERVGDAFQDFQEYLLRSEFVNRTSLVVAIIVLVFGIVVAAGAPVEPVAIVALALICIGPTAWLIWKLVNAERPPSVRLKAGKIPFKRRGQLLILLLLPVAAIGPSVVLHSGWLPFSLIAAAALVAALWRVAVISEKFIWYGLAVFISVPLFGTITGIVRNIADPQVQPVALIRKEDGPDEAIQGIYVTESSDRVYFATVATEGCTDELVPHSGRLLWVPKSDVVAMSVGPPQSVDDAARTALEMSYALTPVLETPAGDHVSLTVAEKRGGQDPEDDPPERRLEDIGPAVQPNFGRGLRLMPENASPGDVVMLRMAAPNGNDEVRGFGPSRQGRTIRLGGVPVDILKEEAESPFEAEYVESSDGRALNLTKDTLFVREDGEWVEVEDEADLGDDEAFVRLTDESVVEVNERGSEGDNYLLIENTDEGPARLAAPGGELPEVVLDDSTTASLKSRLLRQAWHEDHVKFRVPEHATTGGVTVECNQLAGQPLLRVEQPPRASISVQIRPGSRRVVFDSSRSGDNRGIVSRQWWVEGIDRGKDERMAISLPPRPQSYAIRLTVTDSEGQTGTSYVRLLRLPGPLVRLDERRGRNLDDLRVARAELRRATAAEPAAAIEFGMRPGDLSEPPNPERTIDRAEEVRRYLLKDRPARSSSQPADPDGLVVRTMAFGGTCPAERDSEVGRLDVVVLGQGARVIPPEECPVVRISTARWLLPPP